MTAERQPGYLFDVVCPRCNKVSQIECASRESDPRVNCGDCLMEHVEIIAMKIVRVTVLALALLAVFIPAGGARAQYRDLTIYGSDGRMQGRTHTDSQGSSTIYGADGRVQGRTSTGSNGTTTVYGSDGRVQGTITAPSGRGK